MGIVSSSLFYTGHKTWRESADIFSQKEKVRLMSEIGALVPPKQCQQINLLVIGNKGSGKSSLINTFIHVLRNKGRLFTTATTYRIDNPSTTPKLFGFLLSELQEDKKICIFDYRGFERDSIRTTQVPTSYENDLIKTIQGHVKKGYESKDTTIQEDDEFYRRKPTISDVMHCVLFVVNVQHVLGGDHAPLLRIQRRLQDMNIPIRLILTRMDKLCRSDELNGLFWNEKAYQKVEEAKKTLKFQQSQIFPVANYVEGTTQNITQDVLALLALNGILEEALDYINSFFI